MQFTISHHWFGYWLGAKQVTRHYLKQWQLAYWCMHVDLSFSLNEQWVKWTAMTGYSFILEHTRYMLNHWNGSYVLCQWLRAKLWKPPCFINGDNCHQNHSLALSQWCHHDGCTWPGGRFKNIYELLNQRALKFSYVNKIHIFQCMGKIFCVEFQRYPLKFHTKYLTHTLKDMIFMQFWNFKSS